MDKKQKETFFIYAFAFLIFLLFLIGLQKSYEKGVYDALSDVCGELDIGIENDEYVCYNASKQATTLNYNWGWMNNGS